MSAICVFTPMIVEVAWPSLAAAITASLGAAGYQVLASRDSAQERGRRRDAASLEQASERTVEVDGAQGGELAQGMGEEERLVVQKDGFTLTFRRAPDGRLRVCVSGRAASDTTLEAAGRLAMNAFLQDYVRRRVADELKKRGFSLEEERLSDGTVRLKAKRHS